MLRSGLTLLVILLAAPASAQSRFGGGSHGGVQGGGVQGAPLHRDDSHDGVRDDGFHRRVRRARDLVVIYDYGNCGFGFDCGVYDPGYVSGYGYGNGYGCGAGNAFIGGGYSGSGYSGGGYVPDPVGADIPPVIFSSTCWVRRAGYDSSGASVGQVLINLCHPSDNLVVTRVDARAKPPNTGAGTPRSPQ